MKNDSEKGHASDLTGDADYSVLHQNIGISPRRLEGLSEAIYAVAMTLLVLDLRLPTNLAGNQLPSVLRHLLPNLITYALSFMTLGVLWTAHLVQSHWVEHISRLYIWMKIVFLMFIVLIPFSTQLLAAYEYERLSVMIYGLNYLACTTLLLLLWTYATKGRRLVRKDLSEHVVTWLKARLVIATAFAVVALAVALVFSTRAGAVLFIIAQILVIIPTVSIDKIIIWIGPHLRSDTGSVIARHDEN
jgi:uncharacterized membrane protein